jgi:dTDP-4-amino-4,6-dideoxygalactose transaminase|tara:strand:- start:2851 stop:4014 length:1164 start_codon:yes stop_codon:yes gene_type:complete
MKKKLQNKNYLPNQYSTDSKLNINHSYLIEQFSDYKKILRKVENVVRKADYTLGNEVNKFEKNISKRMGSKFTISVGNGTDALFLVLKALNIGPGDEVITTPFTFVATVGSIVTAGAKPVFVDIKTDYNIDENKIQKAITKKTKAVMAVNWSGRPCELDKINRICKKNKIKFIQDACHCIDSKFKQKHIVNFSDAATFSLHPLKNLNVWGDGGFIITNNSSLAKKLYLLRNHGLKNRNNCEVFGYNSRLDTIQAVIANYKIKNKLDKITAKRILNAKRLDRLLKNVSQVQTPPREKRFKEVFHLYQINTNKRDQLMKFLNQKNVDAKIHYPIPIHLQKAAKFLNHKRGDFPIAERVAKTTLSLPVHEFISTKHVDYMANLIKEFFKK